jgi:Flp pilus assembly protein TadG
MTKELRGPEDRAGRERGQSIVELALVVPVLCVILFALVEFGPVANDQVVLDHAAADGARVGARGDSPANLTYAQNETLNYLSDVKQCGSDTATVTYNQGVPDLVTVVASCTYTPLTPLGSVVQTIGQTLSIPATLSSTYTLRVQ